MKIYLITDDQINGLYRAVRAGSRNFERVMQQVTHQEVTISKAAELLIRSHAERIQNRHEEKTQDARGNPGDQPASPEAVPGSG